MSLGNIRQYGLCGSSILFDGDFTNDQGKHLLVHKLEKHLSKDHQKFWLQYLFSILW